VSGANPDEIPAILALDFHCLPDAFRERLVTVAGLFPSASTRSAAGRILTFFNCLCDCGSAGSSSWVVCRLFAPLLGVTFLPVQIEASQWRSGAGSARSFQYAAQGQHGPPRNHHWDDTLPSLPFQSSAQRFVSQQFFHDSDRRTHCLRFQRCRKMPRFSQTSAEMARWKAS